MFLGVIFLLYIFYSIYFIIQYNMLNWFSLQTLQSLNIDFFRMLNIFFPKLHSVSILLLLYSRIYIVGLLYKYLLYLKKNNTQEHRWFLSSYLEKNLQQNKKSILTECNFGKKMFNIRKKSIFNDWSVCSENQFNILYCIIKYIL
jgi:hypothetical protein